MSKTGYIKDESSSQGIFCAEIRIYLRSGECFKFIKVCDSRLNLEYFDETLRRECDLDIESDIKFIRFGDVIFDIEGFNINKVDFDDCSQDCHVYSYLRIRGSDLAGYSFQEL